MRIYSILLSILLSISPTIAFAKGGHSHSSGSHISKTRVKSSVGKTEHVHGYYRKDGTYVQPYNRSKPDMSSSEAYPHLVHFSRGHIAPGFSADTTVERDKHGRIKRSEAAKDAFKRQQPCPATDSSTGSCPGYVIDHVKPLECGGADAPFNMQWQATADGKAKDKTDRYCEGG